MALAATRYTNVSRKARRKAMDELERVQADANDNEEAAYTGRVARLKAKEERRQLEAAEDAILSKIPGAARKYVPVKAVTASEARLRALSSASTATSLGSPAASPRKVPSTSVPKVTPTDAPPGPRVKVEKWYDCCAAKMEEKYVVLNAEKDASPVAKQTKPTAKKKAAKPAPKAEAGGEDKDKAKSRRGKKPPARKSGGDEVVAPGSATAPSVEQKPKSRGPQATDTWGGQRASDGWWSSGKTTAGASQSGGWGNRARGGGGGGRRPSGRGNSGGWGNYGGWSSGW